MANIIYESVRGLSAIPIEDSFLRDRKIFLVGEVNDETCNTLIKELLYMESEDNSKPITLFINSPGGDVGSGLAVYDTIRLLKSPVTAVVTGIAASMGSIILLACDKDKRFMLPSSRIMIHDCSWGRRDMGGKKPFEVEEELKQLEKTNAKLLSIISKRCGKTMNEVAAVTKNDNYFDAEEAISFGLATAILDDKKFSLITKKGA
ncbi:MAG: ATP-dependent Clp protease proteolytic subunit [Lachnospiraceae bacterium]|nr:ATP-dependent Clp protease proteolytic subunit [Lachnospiraceae bacterium]